MSCFIGNVLKEIVEPSGAIIFSNAFTLGDETLNSLELWTAEYQESDAVLIDKQQLPVMRNICDRERCPLDVVGELNGNGRIVLSESGQWMGSIFSRVSNSLKCFTCYIQILPTLRLIYNFVSFLP